VLVKKRKTSTKSRLFRTCFPKAVFAVGTVGAGATQSCVNSSAIVLVLFFVLVLVLSFREIPGGENENEERFLTE
jgi:uncharacterized membrane protein YoaK (UPF0700 family)